MPVSPADLTDEQIDAHVSARLVVAGIDIDLFPTTPDPTTGAPTRDAVFASLRAFVRSTPAAFNTWRPVAPGASGQDAVIYSQDLYPPLEYPSITEAWTDRVSAP
ncbi:hypothetical protein ACXR2U_22855 [Jatrophihabitans sp. YIM 134969]